MMARIYQKVYDPEGRNGLYYNTQNERNTMGQTEYVGLIGLGTDALKHGSCRYHAAQKDPTIHGGDTHD